jgi:hypothetical protein
MHEAENIYEGFTEVSEGSEAISGYITQVVSEGSGVISGCITDVIESAEVTVNLFGDRVIELKCLGLSPEGQHWLEAGATL